MKRESELGVVGPLGKVENLDRPFCLSGRRCYLVGFQNGLFPDYGWHTEDEMGGIWTHPIKVADGLWIGLETRQEEDWDVGQMKYDTLPDIGPRGWLRECDEFILGNGGAWAEHRYELVDFLVRRRQFVPQDESALGIEVEVTAKRESVSGAQLNVLVRFDILPVWFSGWPNPLYLEAKVQNSIVVAHGIVESCDRVDYQRWSGAVGSDTQPDSIAIGENLRGPEKTSGRGISCMFRFPLDLKPSKKIRLVLAGSHEGEREAVQVVQKVLGTYDGEFKRKIKLYNRIAQDNTVIETPEALLNNAFLWSKFNIEWLIQRTPYLGTGVVAGLQDFPWYFGVDTGLSIPGLLTAGFHEEAKESLKLLGGEAEANLGRISHEIVTNGVNACPGHIMETGLFSRAVWDTYLWTGDRKFLEEIYPICRMGMMDYVLKQPRENGIFLLEYEDRRFAKRRKSCPSFVVLGLEALAQMAEIMRDSSIAETCRFEARELRKQIEEVFWIEEEGIYGDQLNEKGRVVCNWPAGAFSEPLGAGYSELAQKSRMEKALSQLETSKYTSNFGVYLTSDRTYCMPIGTGMAAIAEFNYDRVEQGFLFLRLMAKTIGHMMPGAAPEYIHCSGNPRKYLRGSCFTQLWSAAMLTHGLVWGLLRIRPNAEKRRVVMKSSLPEDWASTEIKNLAVGEARINVRITKTKTDVKQTQGPKLDIVLED